MGALGGLWALADRLRNRGRNDADSAFNRMTQLAGELRTELDRKAEEFTKELHEERRECDERIQRVRGDVEELKGRLKRVEDANGI